MIIASIKNTFRQRFFFARLTNKPIIGRIVDYLFFEGDDIIILPADDSIEVQSNTRTDTTSKTIDVDIAVKKPTDTVVPSNIIRHFIKQSKYHFIMNFCICRHSNDCKDYPVELGCLFLGEAVKKIDPSVGRMVTKKEALEHLEKCQKAGLVHLIGRNKIDDVWLRTGPKEKLMTICNCCNCCCLWRMLPNLSEQISSKIKRLDHVSLEVSDLCIGCGTCISTCFVNAIELKVNKGKNEKKATINNQLCRGCGRCVRVCPTQAIKLTIDRKEEAINQSIQRLDSLVDLN